MLTSPRMYSRANLSLDKCLCSCTRHSACKISVVWREQTTMLPNRRYFSWASALSRDPGGHGFHMAEEGEMRTKRTSNILQTYFKHTSKQLQNTCKHIKIYFQLTKITFISVVIVMKV